MTELSRNLIAAAREGLAPDAAIAARVRAKVAAAVAGGVIAASTGSAPAAATASAASTTAVSASPAAPMGGSAGGLALKLGAALLAVGIIATAIVGSERPQAAAPQVAAAPVDSDEPTGTVQVRSAEASVAVEDSGQVPSPASRASLRAPQPAPARAGKQVVTAPAREPITLAREVELVDRAMLLLRKGAVAAALDVVALFERETHGRGQLAEDAAAIEIEARCRLRQDVTAKLAAFDRHWPSSAQRERLQRVCFTR